MNVPTRFGQSISEVFFQAWSSGKITPLDRYGLKSALLEEKLPDDEREAIDRLLHAVRSGWLALES